MAIKISDNFHPKRNGAVGFKKNPPNHAARELTCSFTIILKVRVVSFQNYIPGGTKKNLRAISYSNPFSSGSLESNENDLGASPKQKFEFARFYDEKQ